MWVEHPAEERCELVVQLRRPLVEQPEQDADVALVDAEVGRPRCRGCRYARGQYRERPAG
jgi:hypothetical protein